MTSTQAPDVLVNQIWYSLTTHHTHLAIGTSLARRYPPDVGAFAAVVAPTETALRDLNQIVAKGEMLIVNGLDPKTELPDWTFVGEVLVQRMVCEQPIVEMDSAETILDLTPADVPDMLHLIELTHPGPFLPRTIEMGRYCGIRKDGQLIAMAGERFYPPGYHEISSVCTHPDYQGKGYAALLVSRIATRQQREGDMPYLHVSATNSRAISLYERLGFHKLSEGYAVAMQR